MSRKLTPKMEDGIEGVKNAIKQYRQEMDKLGYIYEDIERKKKYRIISNKLYTDNIQLLFIALESILDTMSGDTKAAFKKLKNGS